MYGCDPKEGKSTPGKLILKSPFQEDPLNSIASGGLTGALLAVRSGPKVMAGSALLGAVILAMIEGVGLVTSRWMGNMFDPTQQAPGPSDAPPNGLVA